MSAAQQAGLKAKTNVKEGKPEEIVVQFAKNMQAELIVIWAGEGAAGHPHIGVVTTKLSKLPYTI
jgi:nucleotide-binding universal stress UspA family protein